MRRGMKSFGSNIQGALLCALVSLGGACGGDSSTSNDLPDVDAAPELDGDTPAEDSSCLATFRGGAVCADDSSRCEQVVRIMSYNVGALPSVAGSNNEGRLKRIGELLAAARGVDAHPDVVLLQEAFDEQDQIFERAGYASILQGPTQTFGLDSGLYVLTDHAVVRQDSESFEECAGSDCLAEKGVTGVEVEIAEVPHSLLVLTTHLQAQSENDDVRVEQIDQLLPYLDQIGINQHASIFAGDFNFKAKPDHDAHPSYVHFVKSTPFTHAGKQCLDNPADCTSVLDASVSDENDLWFSTNDHQFFHAPTDAGLSVKVVRAAVTYTEPFEGESLSDHWAREFDYCVGWAP